MKTKRIKFVLASCTLLLCLAFLGLGVYSVSKPELNITGQISYQASDVSVLVQGRVRDAKIKSTGERLYQQYPTATETLEGYNFNKKILDSAGQYLSYTDNGENQTLSDWNLGDLIFCENSTGVKPAFISLNVTNFSTFPIQVEITPKQSQLDNVLRFTNKTTAILDANTSEYNWDEILIYYTVDDEEKSVSNLDIGFVVKMSRYYAPESTVLKNESGQDVLTYTKVKETTTSTSEYATFAEATTDETGIRITGYNLANDPNKYTKDGTDTADVVIPETIEGLPVVEIGESAFASSEISSVIMPNCIKSILDNAFNSYAMSQIKIPNGTEYLGEFSFGEWTKLDYVDLGTNLKYVDSRALLSSEWEEELNLVVFPSSVKTMCGNIICDDGYEFKVNSIVLSSNLQQITEDMEHYSYRSFCSSTTNKILVDPDNTQYISYNNNLLIELSTKTVVSGTGSTKDIPYDLDVTSIGYSAFQSNTGLTSVNIPESIMSVGDWAFVNSIGLTSLTLPYSLTSIGENTFYGCASLMSVTIPDSVTSIGREAFYDCKSLASITIPNSITEINYSMFCGCSNLTTIAIPEGVTRIGSNAFNSCISLKSIAIPNSVMIIENSAFQYCTGLTSVSIPNGMTSLDSSAFSDCTALKNENNLYGNAYYIGNSSNPYLLLLSAKNTAITECEINSNTRFISNGAFSGCTNLESITISNSVTSIGYSAFYNCTSLVSVTIPKSVTNIESYAFSGCANLTSVIVNALNPPSVKGGSSGFDSFYKCSKLTNIYVPAESVNAYKTADGWKTYASKIVAQS